MDILERDKQWKCFECELSYSKDVIFCEQCQCFRPIEMFKNLLHRPEEVTEFELNALEQRRKKEKQMIFVNKVVEEMMKPIESVNENGETEESATLFSLLFSK